MATKKLFARILIPGGGRGRREREAAKATRSPAHSAESRAGLASYVLLMSVGLDGLGKALVHADIVSSAILTCINSLGMATKMSTSYPQNILRKRIPFSSQKRPCFPWLPSPEITQYMRYWVPTTPQESMSEAEIRKTYVQADKSDYPRVAIAKNASDGNCNDTKESQ